MTVYTPYPKVIFAGAVEYADSTISSISVSLGRRDIYEQPLAGIINIELWTDAETPLNVNLSDSVNVQIKDSTGAYQQIAGGTISDLNITLAAKGEIGSIAIYNITAVGALATLHKRLVGGDGYAKEFDGTRITNILTEAYLTSWFEVSPSLTWVATPNITTWENFDGVNNDLVNDLIANVDAPGDYELTLYNDGASNGLDLAQQAAQSGRGLLYETRQDALAYDSYTSRAAISPLVLTADDLLASGLRQAAQWSEIVNQLTISYKANQEVTAGNATSQFTYGQLSGSRSTQLENAVDAQSQADSFIESRAYPRTYPEELGIALHSPTVSDATRDALIAFNVGRSIYTSILPAVFGTVFNGFVEGIKWNLTRYTAEMTLVCSEISETYPSQIWLQIPATLTWASYTPTNEEWDEL